MREQRCVRERVKVRGVRESCEGERFWKRCEADGSGRCVWGRCERGCEAEVCERGLREKITRRGVRER